MTTEDTPPHLVSPRTLLFLERDGRWLFLLGAAGKWFAGRLNGIGGRMEAGEDAESAARRECREETGLAPRSLEFAATAHVTMAAPHPAVVLFVFVGTLPAGELRPSVEGSHQWHALDALADPAAPFVEDVRTLLPRLLARGGRVLHLAW